MSHVPLPGAVGVSHLSCYEWLAEDGVRGGSPHVHLTCTEAYVVTGGLGAVQTLTVSGYEEHDLSAGSIVWFTPGTVHRMIQRDNLRITVLMQNSGLPEAGDAVFTFPPDVLADPDAYAEAAVLPAKEGPEADAAARRRRDLAVEGYLVLREASQDGDDSPMREFLRTATAIVAPKVERWLPIWQEGALAAAERTGAQLKALLDGDGSHLTQATVVAATPSRHGGYGMCGRRDEYELPGITAPDALRAAKP